MTKNFEGWHKLKMFLQSRISRLFFHEREIWLCSIGVNLGYEQDGKNRRFIQPVVIVKKFNLDLFWAVSLTSKQKFGKYYFQFKFGKKTTSAIISQLRVMDRKRLLRKIGVMTEADFASLKQKLKELL